MAYFEAAESSTPSTPASGYSRAYPKSDGLWYCLDDGGKEYPLSALVLRRTAVNDAGYTALATDYLIAYTALSSGRTVALPAASTMTNRVLVIKDESGNAGASNITIDPNSSELIDGASTKVINTNYGTATIYCNGTAWFSI